MAESSVYRLNSKTITGDRFEARLDQAWLRIQSDPDIASRLSSIGLDPANFRGKSRQEFITVDKRSRAGMTGLETVVVNFASGAAIKLFEVYVLPYIKRGLNREDVELDSKKAKGGQDAARRS